MMQLICNNCLINLFRRSPNLVSKRAYFKKKRMENLRKWMQCGAYEVFVWSVAGVETSIVVRGNGLHAAFDMGYSSRESVGCKNVFISHGHMDHISAIPQHAAKRGLYGMDPATYYVPSHLPDLVRSVAQIYQTIDTTTESLGDIKVVSLSPGDTIQLPDGFFVKPFPTVHRVPSQGYIVYKNKRNLKEEYKNLPSKEVAELFRGGVDIHNVVTSPEIAYMGDTTFEVFESPPTPDLLKVKVLITEATYIEDEDGKDRVGQARERGHIHLAEIVNHEHLFKDINHIVLSHLSDKYSVSFAQNFIPGKLTASLKDKVQIATLARERTS